MTLLDVVEDIAALAAIGLFLLSLGVWAFILGAM